MKKVLVLAMMMLLPILALAESPRLILDRKFNFNGKNDQPSGMVIDNQNNTIINGLRDPAISLADVSPFIGKYSENGTIIWGVLDKTKSATSIQNQMAVLQNGDIFQTFDEVVTNHNSYLKKLDSNGNEIWRKKMDWITYLTNWGDTLVVIVEKTSTVHLMDKDGEITRSFPLGQHFSGYIAPVVKGDFLFVSGLIGNNGALAKFSLPTGEQKWLKTVSQMVNNLCAADDDGNAYLGGSRITTDTSGFLAHFLAKFDKNGNILWQQQWFSRGTYETNYENWSIAIAVSSEKNAVMVGGTFQRGGSHTWDKSAFLKEFSASLGKPIWEKKWDYDQGLVISQVRGLAFDKNGDLNVLGNSVPYSINTPNYCYFQRYQIDRVLSVGDSKPTLPSDFRLEQNYPNPFNPSTRIRFEVPKESFVKLAVYNLLGQEIKILVQEVKSAGVYETDFDASGLPSGTYLYRFQSGNFVQVKKMILLR